MDKVFHQARVYPSLPPHAPGLRVSSPPTSTKREPPNQLLQHRRRHLNSFSNYSRTGASPNMSDNGEVEVESPSGYQVLPKDVTDEIGTVKLFNKWSYEDVEIRDISLT